MGLHTTQFCNTALVKELHSTFLARVIFSYGDQNEGFGGDDHASSNSNNNSTKIFIDSCPLSIQSQFTLKTCLKVPWILFMQWRVSTKMSEIHLPGDQPASSLEHLLPVCLMGKSLLGAIWLVRWIPGSQRSSPLSKF